MQGFTKNIPIDNDGTLSANSDFLVPSQKAVKTYVDTENTTLDGTVVHNTGNETVAGVKTFTSDPIIPDEAYGVGWDGSLEPPTKNAVYDKVENLSPIASPTFTGTVTTPAIIVSSETASRVAIIDASKNVKSADTATYPSLTELAYVKGVTSAVQTQLDAIGDITGTGLFIFMIGGDQTTTSATLSNITELVTPTLEINSRYVIQGILHIGCDNTGGVFIACDVPASSSFYISLDGVAGSATTYLGQRIVTDATSHGTAFGRFNNSNNFVTFSGEIETAGTANVANLMFASAVGGQTSTIYETGSWLFIKKIA